MEPTAPVKKRYWLTPPDVLAKYNEEFNFDFDPCPHPRLDDFDGLVAEWGYRNWVNPPFTGGVMKWVHKAQLERSKGKLVVMIIPVYQTRAVSTLGELGAEIRYVPPIAWLAIEDGSAKEQRATDRLPCLLFILRP